MSVRLSSALRTMLCCFVFLLPCSLWGQVADVPQRETFISWEDFATDYLLPREEEEVLLPADTRSGELDDLLALYEHPLPLNSVTRDELLVFPFLRPEQADSIVAYRGRLKGFHSLGELMLVRQLSYTERRWLSLFVFVDPPESLSPTWRERAFGGHHQVELRADFPLYRRAGFTVLKPDGIARNPQTLYLGHRFGHTLRYRYAHRTGVNYGLTLQNDVGEPFGMRGNRPYDFTSFHLVLGRTGSRRQLFLGDYRAKWGQGLLIGRQFLSSPLLLLQQPSYPTARLSPHTGSDEVQFLRGAAVALRGRHWAWQVLVSHRQRDGRTEGDTVRSFLTSGLHRSLRELSRRNVVGVFTFGNRLEWHNPRGTFGLNAYAQHYDKFVLPRPKLYNLHSLRGRSAHGMSVDYGWAGRKWSLSGETAVDAQGHWATTHTAQMELHPAFRLTSQLRWLSAAFVSPLGETLQQGTHTQNEMGAFLGWQWDGLSRVEMRGFIDVFRFPQPTFRADTASQGFEVLWEAVYHQRDALLHTLRYHVKARQQNIPRHAPHLEYQITHHLRWQLRSETSRRFWQLAMDVAAHHRQTHPHPTWGGMCSARVGRTFGRAVRLNAFAGVFLTENHATRLYAYLPQLPGVGAFPQFSGRGCALALVGRWEPSSHLRVHLRWGWTRYFDRATIGQDMQKIFSPQQHDLALALRYRF